MLMQIWLIVEVLYTFQNISSTTALNVWKLFYSFAEQGSANRLAVAIAMVNILPIHKFM